MFSLNTNKIREDFPIYERKINGQKIIYMDSSCMSLRPKQVINKITDYYTKYSACAGRSSHKLAKETTIEYENGREQIKKYLSTQKESEIIFTRNATEGINIVSNSLDLKKDNKVITTDREHNSNVVPWHVLRYSKGIKHDVVMSNEDMTFSIEKFKEKLTKDTKLVSVVHSSNIDGYTTPIKEIIDIAHDNGSLVMIDAAQSAPHKEINVKKLDVDFLTLSGHKMLGPSGTGILYGKYHLLEKIKPYNTGGDTVSETTYDTHEFLPPPEKFEAGPQNYAGGMGLGAAAKYLMKVGLNKIAEHEIKLNKYITNEIKDINGLKILGPQEPSQRGGIISFTVDDVDPHDIALMLSDTSNIMVRSGVHCAHSWFNSHNLNGSCRASMYLYNTLDEAKIFVEELKKVLDVFTN